MVSQLPEIIDPFALVEKRTHLRGALPLSKMSRLKDLLIAQEGEAKLDLRFGKEDGIATATGVVEADLLLQCQLCLNPMQWHVISRVSLGIVRSYDEADRLPERYEPLLLDAKVTMAVIDIVQDELLLALPHIPQHENCDASPPEIKSPAPKPTKKVNPFAVLANLK